jgi:NADH-quinone oxidoreductase subunit C
MKTSVERLTGLFVELIGPEAMKPKPAAPAPAVAAAPVPAPAAAGATPAPAAQPAAPAAPVVPPPPVQAVSHALKGFDFDAAVAPSQVVAAAQIMDREGFALDAVTGVDWIAQNEMEIVYDYFHPTEPLRAVVRTRVPRAEPELPTISPVFPGANWHERETHDFFGIRFAGHPNMKPFLLPEDAEFHPLRKDYQP